MLLADVGGPLERGVVIHRERIPNFPEKWTCLSHSGDIVGHLWNTHPAHEVLAVTVGSDVGAGRRVYEGHIEICFSRARSVAQAILSATLRVSELAVVTAVTWRASSMHEIAYHDCSIVQGGPDVNSFKCA